MSVAATNPGDSMTSGSSQENATGYLIVSPIAVDYAPQAFINVDSEQLAAVNVTGIQQKFVIDLSGESDVVALLNGFRVAGAKYDTRLPDSSGGPAQIVDADLSALAVSMDSDAKAALRAVIEKGLDQATNGAGNVLDTWLAGKLRDAFSAAFGNLPTGTVAGAASEYDASEGMIGTDAAPGGAASGAAVETAIGITSSTAITGFAVDVLTDSDAASNEFWNQHDVSGAANLRNFIYRQIPAGHIKAYLPDNLVSNETLLTTDALPLLKGDSMAFIFDVDLKDAGQDPTAGSAATAEDVPTTGSGGNGVSNFQLNLGMRRVTIEFKLTAEPTAHIVTASDQTNTYELRAQAVAQGAAADAADNTAGAQ